MSLCKEGKRKRKEKELGREPEREGESRVSHILEIKSIYSICHIKNMKIYNRDNDILWEMIKK